MLERRGVLVYLVIGTILSGSAISNAQICYVDVNVTGGANNGSSWTNAYGSLSFAIPACLGQSEIRVADGIYRPNDCGGAPCGRGNSFRTQVPIYGGYAGASDPTAARNPAMYETILSGDIVGNDNNFDCVFPPPEPPDPNYTCRNDNLYTVVNMELNEILDGVIVEGGYSAGPAGPGLSGPTGFGGGIRVFGASQQPQDSDLARIDGCVIRRNYASYGGGIQAGVLGLNTWKNVMVVNSTIEDNHVGTNGGGIEVENRTRLWVYNSKVQNNSSRSGGGGIHFENPGFMLYGEIVNSLIAGNEIMTGFESGGGVFVEGTTTSVRIANCTIIENFATMWGGGVYAQDTLAPERPLIIDNCIIRDNDAGEDGRQIGYGNGTPTSSQVIVRYSNVTQANVPGMPIEIYGEDIIINPMNSIDADPDFVDADGPDDDANTVADNDYRLRSGSPSIDSGNTLLVPLDLPDLNGVNGSTDRVPFDLIGQDRIYDDVLTANTGVSDPPTYPAPVDMGAFEGLHPPVEPPTLHNRQKNRYISFSTANGSGVVGFRVVKDAVATNAGFCTGNPGAACTGAPAQGTCPGGSLCVASFPTGSPAHSCWVQAPEQTSNSNPAHDVQYTALCDATPVYRVWTEPVVHVGDCEIIPTSTYHIFTNAPGGVENPNYLEVKTIEQPTFNSKVWGDTVGINNGEWTAPNRYTNVQDVLALLAIISGAAIRPHFTVANLQATSAPDPCLNCMVNIADVLIANQAISGATYGAPSTGKITNTSTCSICPPCPVTMEGFAGGGGGEGFFGPESFSSAPTFDLNVTPYQIGAEESATVSVYLDAAEVIGGYEVSLDVTGGTTGTLTRETITINTNHNNFLFAGHGTYLATNVESNMAGAVEAGGTGVLASGDEYLATYTFLASSDAEGVFEVRVSDERSFILDEEGNQVAHDASVVAYVRVGVECTSAAHCDDGNQCTSDTCTSNQCVNTNLSNGTGCDDGMYCTLTDTCNGSGVCVGSSSPCGRLSPVCCEETDSCHPTGYECGMEM